MTLTHLKTSINVVYRTLVRREQPVIVYTPGRVGSMSTVAAVRAAGKLAYKVESFTTEKRGSVAFCKKQIIDTGRPAHIITLVRDPIEILISLYFSKLKHLPPVDRTDVAALHTHFITHMLEDTKYHAQYLHWFATEFAPHLGFSAFDYPFDAAAGHATIAHDRFPTLIMRLDLPNETKSKLVSDFLNTPVTITTSNVKTKDPVYVEFKKSLSLPAQHVSHIYNLPYTQHFFTEAERAEMTARWAK